jgi:hypothetical protein
MGQPISPFQALLAARDLDPWNKVNRTLPKRPHDPKGTGSFMRFIHEVGFVIDLLLDSCQIDPFVLVETGAIAAVEAAWSIISPDIKEGYHQIVGQSLVCTLKQEIRGARSFDSKFWNGAQRNLFKLAEVADLAVWRLFLASVFADGLADWMTMAETIQGCRGSKSDTSSSLAYGAIPDANAHYPGNGFDWVTGNPEFPVFPAVTVITPGNIGYIVWCANAEATDHNPVPMISFIEVLETGEQLDRQESVVAPDGKIHPIIHKVKRFNTGATAETLVVRARAAVGLPTGQAYFHTGFCAVR